MAKQSEENAELAEDRLDMNLQRAPAEDSAPDFAALKKAFSTCLSDSQGFIDQQRRNYETRYAIWNGQSADGRKHARTPGAPDPTPWDGASDLRVFLTDEAINSKVAMLRMAFRKANFVAMPVEVGDLKRAKEVSNFMHWLMQTQVPNIDRETELLCQFLQEQGIAATGQFWQTKQEKKLQQLTVAQFQQALPKWNVAAMLQDKQFAPILMDLFEREWGCTPKKAKKILKDLQTTGQSSVAIPGPVKSFPVIRAFNFKENLFVDGTTTDLENAAAIYRIEYFSPAQLRSFALNEGWDEEWVEDAIEKCLGKRIQLDPTIQSGTPQQRSFVYIEPKYENVVGVVYAYQKLSDEDGIPGIYLSIFNPDLPPNPDKTEGHDGFAKTGLLDDGLNCYPFAVHKREYLSRRFYDSRGIPEVGKPIQDQIKVHKDSSIDAASFAILPPMGFPAGRPPSKWGAGARIPERRQGEYHFMDRPMPDLITDKSQEQLQADFNRYLGFVSPEADPQFASLKNQHEVDSFLTNTAEAYKQVWKLYKRYGSEQTYFRVIGVRTADPTLFKKGNEDEEYDMTLTWDVQSMDPEIWNQKLEMIGKAINTYNGTGAVNMGEWLNIIITSIDPNIAEQILQPDSVGAAKAKADEQDALAQIFAGIAKNIDISSPPDIGLQTMQEWMQQPDVQQRYMNDKYFAQRVNTRVKQYQFQKTQKQNAQIGRLGAVQQIPDSMQQGQAPQ